MVAMAEPGAPDGARLDFRGAMSYGDYLDLDRLLAAQHPRSDAHDELLFIVQHQTTELWLKQVLHELQGARRAVAADELAPAFKMLARVSRIMAQLVQAWDVLATLTPSEYSAFRPSLGDSSGFQSYQYRAVELILGNKQPALLAPHAHRPDLHEPLLRLLHEPSLYDEALRALARRGVPLPADVVERDWAEPRAASPRVEAWLEVYRAPGQHWDLYELAEDLVDLEDAFRQWRFRHLTTVARVIGGKRGTGGTHGVGYLRGQLDLVLFPELWSVRTAL